jgi:hypothetical protein
MLETNGLMAPVEAVAFDLLGDLESGVHLCNLGELETWFLCLNCRDRNALCESGCDCGLRGA